MAMVASSLGLSYEDARKQRVEENNRRMAELGLFDLSKSLKEVKNVASARKPLAKRKVSSQELTTEARRSGRNAGKMVSYREQLDMMPGMRMRCGTRDRQSLARRYLSDAARMAAVDAAEEVYKDIKNPAFVKPMLHSHTASGFWLGLPSNFCKQYLPHRDERIVLEDEQNMEWECLYLAHKVGLSGGWRGFSLDHELVDGDSCIFELVGPTRFKVYIFRCEEQFEGGEKADGIEGGENVSHKHTDTGNKKKTGGMKYYKKSPASAPPEIGKPRRLSTSTRKLDLEDKEEDDDSPKASEMIKKEVHTDLDSPSKPSKRRCVKEDGDSKVGEVHQSKKKDVRSMKQKEGCKEVVDLDSKVGGDDAHKYPAQSNGNQLEIRSFGRITRSSIARSLAK